MTKEWRGSTTQEGKDLYAVLVWKPPQIRPRKLWFGDAVEALWCATTYLREGYQVRGGQP